MANSFLTRQQITDETLRILANAASFAQRVNGTFSAQMGDKIGDTIHVRRPPNFYGHDEFAEHSRIHAERIAALRRRRTEWRYYLTFSRAA